MTNVSKRVHTTDSVSIAARRVLAKTVQSVIKLLASASVRLAGKNQIVVRESVTMKDTVKSAVKHVNVKPTILSFVIPRTVNAFASLAGVH